MLISAYKECSHSETPWYRRQSLTCSCMRAYDSAMRTTASSWRTVIGTTGVSLSFSLAAARACMVRRHQCLNSQKPSVRLLHMLTTSTDAGKDIYSAVKEPNV